MSYVDLHLHVLPGVDDGARDQAEALAYVRRLAAEGVREATATPHVRSTGPAFDLTEIPMRVASLQRAIDAASLAVQLHAGGEIHPDRADDLGRAELELIANGPPGARWLLFEAPFDGIDEPFLASCERLRGHGYGLLIAHPERSAGLLDGGLDLLAGELAAGSLLQVNVCSLLGNNGLSVQEAAVELLRTGIAHVIASDAHPGSREHTLRVGFDLALRSGASSVQAWRLTQANPRFLLRHGIPPGPSPATLAAMAALAD